MASIRVKLVGAKRYTYEGKDYFRDKGEYKVDEALAEKLSTLKPYGGSRYFEILGVVPGSESAPRAGKKTWPKPAEKAATVKTKTKVFGGKGKRQAEDVEEEGEDAEDLD